MPIKTKTIPFGPLMPDQGEHQNPGLLNSSGLFPFSGGFYIPEGRHASLSDTISSSSRTIGGVAVSMGDYLYQCYVGSQAELYEVNSLGGGTWGVDEVSQNATAPYTVDATGWHFLQFGTHLIAVPGVSYDTTKATYPAGTGGESSRIQWLGDTTVGGGTGDAANLDPDVMWPGTGTFPDTQKEFQDLFDYTDATIYHLKARFVAPLGRRILLGHVLQENATPTDGASAGPGYYPNRVHWSVTDDPTSFTDEGINAAHLSGFADLLDDWGPITGMSGGSDYALIFKARGIYRMSWGGAFAYSFQPIPNSLGCRWSHSIVRVGNDVYFWGPSGPCVFRGSEGRVIELGLGRVSRSLLDSTWVAGSGIPDVDYSLDEWILSACHDSSNGAVVWGIPDVATSPSHAKTLLVYNYHDDRFSSITRATTESLGDFHYIFSNPDAADDFSTFRDVIAIRDVIGQYELAGWKSGVTSNSNAVVITTGFYELTEAGRSRVTRVRLLFSLNSGETSVPTITVTVNSREMQYGSSTASSGTNTSNQDKMGYISLPSSPYSGFHQFSFQIDPTDREKIAEIEGFQVEYELGGTR